MDSAFKSSPYPGYTVGELRAAVEAGRSTPTMIKEIARRDAVAAGDMSQATSGERLRAAQA